MKWIKGGYFNEVNVNITTLIKYTMHKSYRFLMTLVKSLREEKS